MIDWENIPTNEIKQKYLKPPSHDEIFSFIDELGVTYTQFERYYSIPYSVIRSIKCGNRHLPVKFWPIIYERIVPQYGIEFLRATKNASKSIPQKHVATKPASVAYLPDNELHDRITTVK